MISNNIFNSDIFSGQQLYIKSGIAANSEGIKFLDSSDTTFMHLTDGGDVSIKNSLELEGNASIANSLGVGGNLTVTGDFTVNGTTTTINSTTLEVDDKNIEMGVVDSPTDSTADGGGITLKGDTDKTIAWYNSVNEWQSNQSFSTADGKYFRSDKLKAKNGDGLYIVDDGDNGIFVKDGGSVGIGTNVPAALLDISSAGAVASNIIWAKADGLPGNAGYTGAWTTYGVKYHSAGRPDYSYSVGVDTTQAGVPKFRIGYSFAYADRPGDNPLLTVESNGNVGIGSTDPDCDLTIQGKDSSDGGEAKLCLASYDGTQNGAFAHVDEAGSERISIRVGGHSSATEKMAIFNNGNVGIGVSTDDGSILHIKSASANTIGLSRSSDIRNSAGGSAAKIEGGALNNTTREMGGAIGFALYDTSSDGSATAGYTYFETKDIAGSLTEKARITAGGHFAVGLGDPRESIHTTGRLYLNEVAAPSTTTNRLYNVGGNLFWNGTDVSTDTNTNQLTTFGWDADGSTATTVSHGDTLSIVGGTNCTTSRASNVITVNATAQTSNYSQGFTLNQDAETSSAVQFARIGVNTTPSGTAGSIVATNDIIAFASSDERLKDNVTVLSDPIKKISQIKGVNFVWNDESYDHLAGHDVGVLAQDVEKVLPEVVATRDDGYKAVRYEKMVPLLIEAIKDQQQQITDLKSRLDEAGL